MVMHATLSPEDLAVADQVGRARTALALARGRPERHVARDRMAADVQGARSELAFLRMLGQPLLAWTAYVETDDLRGLPPDVAGWQVRSTMLPRGGLIVHPDDRQGEVFALVIDDCPHFTSPGWIAAREAKQRRHWASWMPTPCYLVRQDQLHSWAEWPQGLRAMARKPG